MTPPVQHDWFAIGQGFVLFAVGMITAWNAYRASRTAKTVDQVHSLVNSAMGAQKKTLAEVTAAKALLTNGTAQGVYDQEAADAALKDYLDHVAKQSKVDGNAER